MSEIDYELLSRFVDGELPEAERGDLEKALGENPELAAQRDEILGLGALLREHTAGRVEQASFEGFWQGVETQLSAAPVAAPAPASAAPVAEQAPALLDRLSGWLRAYWLPVGVSAAAAAALAFMVTRPGVEPAEPAAGGPVAVEAVNNSGDQTVLISQPAEDDEGATVIWLIEDDEDEEDPSTLGEDPI